MSYEFETDAKRLLAAEMNSDSLTAIAGLVLLFESIGTHGQIATKYLNLMFEMAARMRLFGVENRLNAHDYALLSQAGQRSTGCVAWGAFNFFT
jgi:hypothetical protein